MVCQAFCLFSPEMVNKGTFRTQTLSVSLLLPLSALLTGNPGHQAQRSQHSESSQRFDVKPPWFAPGLPPRVGVFGHHLQQHAEQPAAGQEQRAHNVCIVNNINVVAKAVCISVCVVCCVPTPL